MGNLSILRGALASGQVSAYTTGAITLPSARTAFETGFNSIATVTTTSGQTVVTFSSIPSTYKSLQIRGILRNSAGSGSDNAYMLFNSDTGNNYTTHWISGDGATATASSVSPWTLQLVGFIPASGATANSFAVTIIDIHDYASTTKYKTVRYFTGNDRNGSGSMFVGSSSWMNTAAISTLSFNCSDAFELGTTFALYGIKG